MYTFKTTNDFIVELWIDVEIYIISESLNNIKTPISFSNKNLHKNNLTSMKHVSKLYEIKINWE